MLSDRSSTPSHQWLLSYPMHALHVVYSVLFASHLIWTVYGNKGQVPVSHLRNTCRGPVASAVLQWISLTPQHCSPISTTLFFSVLVEHHPAGGNLEMLSRVFQNVRDMRVHQPGVFFEGVVIIVKCSFGFSVFLLFFFHRWKARRTAMRWVPSTGCILTMGLPPTWARACPRSSLLRTARLTRKPKQAVGVYRLL